MEEELVDKENNEPPVPGMESVSLQPPVKLFKIDIPKEEETKRELVVTGIGKINCRKYAINIEKVLMNPGRKTRPKKWVDSLKKHFYEFKIEFQL